MGGERREPTPVSRLEQKKFALFCTLQEVGIDLNVNPSKELPNNNPGQWLLRGEEGQVEKLRKPDSLIVPHYGEYGSFGVFLGDRLSPLMFPDNGFYFVFARDVVSACWLSKPSTEWEVRFSDVVGANHLDPTHINDGFEAEAEIYRNNYVYCSRTGVCTSPLPLLPAESSFIVVTSGLIGQTDIKTMPSEVRSKLLIVSY